MFRHSGATHEPAWGLVVSIRSLASILNVLCVFIEYKSRAKDESSSGSQSLKLAENQSFFFAGPLRRRLLPLFYHREKFILEALAKQTLNLFLGRKAGGGQPCVRNEYLVLAHIRAAMR